MRNFVLLALGGYACGLLSGSALAQSPRLTIELHPAQQANLSWTNAGTQLFLQNAGTLRAPIVWQKTQNTPVLQSNRFSLDIDLTGTEQYFRLAGASLTRISSTSPEDREVGVSVNRETIFYFSQPLAETTTLTGEQFFARLNQRKILSRIELSSDRLKATLFYLEPIPGGARLIVTLDGTGVKDEFGQDLDADGDGKPGGVKLVQFDTYSTTPVPGTAVIGHIYASDRVPDGRGGFTNQPLQGVTITVDGAEETLRATTDAQGAFTLASCPAGRFFVHVDGRTEIHSKWPNGAYYPVVGKAWETVAGRSDNLASGTGEIFLPLIPDGTLQPVSPVQDTVITFAPSVLAANPQFQGVHITVPANSLFSDDGQRGGRVGIALVASDRLPEPLPPGLDHVLDITVQTDGPSNFDRPVPACFPNVADSSGRKFAPGERAVLMSYNHDTGKWEVVGSMTTSSDSKFVCTDPGVGIRQPGWHGVQPPPFEPLGGGGCGGGTGGAGSGGAPASVGTGTPPVDNRKLLAGPSVGLLDDVPLAPLCNDPCFPFNHGTASIEECLQDSDDQLDDDQKRCEDDFNQCSPCVASAACTGLLQTASKLPQSGRQSLQQTQW